MKKYLSYKNSNISWLGAIPSHWSLERLSQYFVAKKGCNAAQLTKEYCGKNEGIFPVYSGQTKNHGVMCYINQFEFDSGTDGYLFSTTVGAKAMSVMHIKGKFSLSQNCMVIIPKNKEVNIRFIFFQLQPLFSYQRKIIPEHMQASFRMEDLYSYSLAIPPFQEQSFIANFLDHETQKIDILISEQQKFITLLTEKRQAVISHTVTKGLSHNVAMKDSGLEWLGKIPSHWKIKKVKWLFKIKKNIANKLGYDVLSITQNGIKVKDIKSGDGQLSMDYSKYQIVTPGDFTMNHMDLLTGYVDIASTPGVTSPDYRVFSIRDNKTCYDKYYLYMFQIGYKNKIFYAYGQGSSQLGRWRLSTDQFNDFFLPFLPYEEQKAIAHFLDKENEKFDRLISGSKKIIALLKERRTALISAAVTGKIDVRDITPDLPMESSPDVQFTPGTPL